MYYSPSVEPPQLVPNSIFQLGSLYSPDEPPLKKRDLPIHVALFDDSIPPLPSPMPPLSSFNQLKKIVEVSSTDKEDRLTKNYKVVLGNSFFDEGTEIKS